MSGALIAQRLGHLVQAVSGTPSLPRCARLQGALRVATMDIIFRRYHGAFSSVMARFPSVELTVTSSDTEGSLTRREATWRSG